MFTSVHSRAASAYRRVAAETSVQTANPHQLVGLLFDALLQSIATARGALQRGDVAAKGVALVKAVRIIEEGLKSGLDKEEGGELAQNLEGLYGYCTMRLALANARNDEAVLAEVASLIGDIADAWKSMKNNEGATTTAATDAGA